MTLTLGGIIPPLVTPFNHQGAIDEAALRSEVDYHLGIGVDGICVTGSTGEGASLSEQESAEVARIAVSAARGRVPVIAGVIQNSTDAAIRYGQAIAKTGVSALQVTPVHYLFSPDDDSTVTYYQQIAEETGLPILIYNVIPWARIEPRTLARVIEEVSGVVGVKQSGGDMHALADLLDMAPNGGAIFTAVDDLLYPSFVLGAHGAIAAILTVAPGLCVELWEAVRDGDHERALKLHGDLLALWRAVEGTNLPAKVKESLRRQGREVGAARRPTSPVSTGDAERIDASLLRAGLRR